MRPLASVLLAALLVATFVLPSTMARPVESPQVFTVDSTGDQLDSSAGDGVCNDGTGNFFFETISNKEKNTLGCFLKTQADFLFYYFVEPRMLYILHMPRTRGWFEENMGRFEEREAATPVGKDHYITVGRIVPIEIVLAEVRGVKIKQL